MSMLAGGGRKMRDKKCRTLCATLWCVCATGAGESDGMKCGGRGGSGPGDLGGGGGFVSPGTDTPVELPPADRGVRVPQVVTASMAMWKARRKMSPLSSMLDASGSRL